MADLDTDLLRRPLLAAAAPIGPVKLWERLATTVVPAAVPAKAAPVTGAAKVVPPPKAPNPAVPPTTSA